MNFRTPINLETDDYMDVKEARQVAGDFHGGQNSALYSFSSTGKLYFPNSAYINELKTVTDESLTAYADSQDAINDKYRLMEFFNVQPETAITENAKYDKFKAFLESIKEYDPTLIESIQEGFNICFEAYEDVYTPDNDGYTQSAPTSEQMEGDVPANAKWIMTGSISGRDVFGGSADDASVARNLKNMKLVESKYRPPQSFTAELMDGSKVLRTITLDENGNFSFN